MVGHVSSLVIPEDALRIRIIANSNSEYDQEIKTILKEKIQYEMYNLLKDSKGIEEARKIINANLSSIDMEVSNTLKDLNYDLGYEINYGLNYFPSKEYKGTTYEDGYYESLVITLGSGEGDNWWCVLFPPLCLLEASDSTDVEYTSFVKELIDKYM
jgi:stage II sporulation protein R